MVVLKEYKTKLPFNNELPLACNNCNASWEALYSLSCARASLIAFCLPLAASSAASLALSTTLVCAAIASVMSFSDLAYLSLISASLLS